MRKQVGAFRLENGSVVGGEVKGIRMMYHGTNEKLPKEFVVHDALYVTISFSSAQTYGKHVYKITAETSPIKSPFFPKKQYYAYPGGVKVKAERVR